LFVVLKQDDEVAEVMAELHRMEAFRNMDNVQYLNSATFHSVTRDLQQTIVMVLFYVTCEEIFIFATVLFLFEFFIHISTVYIYNEC